MLRGEFAADIVAALAIVTALVLREPFAGLVIVLMQSGGEALETWAAGRASDAVRALEAAAPHVANRLAPDGSSTEIPVEQVHLGDHLLVRPGELVPVDGIILEGEGELDESRLTGEPLPKRAGPGTAAVSGTINGTTPLVLRADALAAESRYAKLVDAVRLAQASKARLQRTADRWAVWFTPLTLVVAAAAVYASGDPRRALAVLVVATPCPMILAVPVAIVAGINRSASRGLILRRGEALERLASADALLVDKTGTLTLGRPDVVAVSPAAGTSANELLALAAAVEEGSGHLLARSLVARAKHDGVAIPSARDIVEVPGHGVRGTVHGRQVRVGNAAWLASEHPTLAAEISALLPTALGTRALVVADGRLLGSVTFADQLRPEADRALQRLRTLGLGRQILASGDDAAAVDAVGLSLGLSARYANLRPEQKAELVRAEEAAGRRVLMLGDGVNDAPAMAAAHVAVAVAASGAGLSAATADAVLLVEDLDCVADGVVIARRTLRIARQSLVIGLTLSTAAMGVAAMGWLAPAVGALVQEAIDVAAILNALRAARADVRPPAGAPAPVRPVAAAR